MVQAKSFGKAVLLIEVVDRSTRCFSTLEKCL